MYAKNIKDLMMNPNLGSDEAYASLKSDIIACYREKKYQTNANNIDAKAKTKYQGEDVEVSYVWDLTDGTRYTVVNRRLLSKSEKETWK